jgi:hypothetical protein
LPPDYDTDPKPAVPSLNDEPGCIKVVDTFRDPSLDAGYLALRIGECCELLGDQHAAKWWYGRAVEENPEIPAYAQARQRLEHITIDDLLPPPD